MKKKTKVAYSHSPLSRKIKRYLKKQGYKSVVNKYCPVGQVYLLNAPLTIPLSKAIYELPPYISDVEARVLFYGSMVSQRNVNAKFTELTES